MQNVDPVFVITSCLIVGMGGVCTVWTNVELTHVDFDVLNVAR